MKFDTFYEKGAMYLLYATGIVGILGAMLFFSGCYHSKNDDNNHSEEKKSSGENHSNTEESYSCENKEQCDGSEECKKEGGCDHGGECKKSEHGTCSGREHDKEGKPETKPTPPTQETSAIISQEEFEKAFTLYLQNNPVEFGKQVDQAYQIYQKELEKEAKVEKSKQAKNVPNISESDHVMGDPNATFVLYEYSDYHCPYCKRFHPTTKEFLKNNPDTALVLRPYPGVHRNTSAPIHQIAECVAKEAGNDAFWSFSDSAFEKGTKITPENAQAEIESLNIEKSDAIMKCYENKEFVSHVNDTEQEAMELGIQGTPGSILKNTNTGEVRVIEGAQPLEALQNAKNELE